MTVTRGIQMKKGSQHMRKAPIRKTRVIEAFASFDIISGSVLRALLVGGLSRWMHWKTFCIHDITVKGVVNMRDQT